MIELRAVLKGQRKKKLTVQKYFPFETTHGGQTKKYEKFPVGGKTHIFDVGKAFIYVNFNCTLLSQFFCLFVCQEKMERVVNEPFSEPRDDSGLSLTCLYFSILNFFFPEKVLNAFQPWSKGDVIFVCLFCNCL